MAIRALLEFALEDRLNQRFALLSESDIPLYPATVVWLQLMNEQQSRIRSCPGPLVSRVCLYLLLHVEEQCISHAKLNAKKTWEYDSSFAIAGKE